jgi:hypothetical protein
VPETDGKAAGERERELRGQVAAKTGEDWGSDGNGMGSGRVRMGQNGHSNDVFSCDSSL